MIPARYLNIRKADCFHSCSYTYTYALETTQGEHNCSTVRAIPRDVLLKCIELRYLVIISVYIYSSAWEHISKIYFEELYFGIT